MGKDMKNNFYKTFLIILFSSIVTTQLYGKTKTHITKEKKGQKHYINNCSSCHGAGNIGGNMYSMDEWEILFKEDAKELINLHKEELNTEKIIKYFKSKKFKKQKGNMLKFLKEFAYDSDYIPTCN